MPLTRDTDGRTLLVNFRRAVVLHHFNFKRPVKAVTFLLMESLYPTSFLKSWVSQPDISLSLPTLTPTSGGHRTTSCESLHLLYCVVPIPVMAMMYPVLLGLPIQGKI